MRIWTLPFLLLFLGAAAALSLVVIFPLPTWLFWVALGLELAICVVGGWLTRSRLLQVGFFLQAILTASGLLSLVLDIPRSLFASSPHFNLYFSLSGATALLSAAVFVCLSYGIAPGRAPLDVWLTVLQVALALGAAVFLLMRNFSYVPFIPGYLGLLIEEGFSLACQFFVVLLLLLRGACWKSAPIAIALLLVSCLLSAVTSTLLLQLYGYGLIFGFPFFQGLIYAERADFPLFFLGLLVLIQTWRVRGNQQPTLVPVSPAPAGS
jgi:hypothetical protein